MIPPLVSSSDVSLEERRSWDPLAPPFDEVKAEERRVEKGRAIEGMLEVFSEGKDGAKEEGEETHLDSPRLRGMMPSLGEGGRWLVGGREMTGEGYVEVGEVSPRA